MATGDTNDFEQFITDRTDLSTGTPATGSSGDFEQFITDRIDLSTYVKVAAAPPAGAIMNQIQFANLGADLYNGTLI